MCFGIFLHIFCKLDLICKFELVYTLTTMYLLALKVDFILRSCKQTQK